MKKLNNKGYMLIELILASALAFGIAYFLISLTMQLKNKNDDMLVETLTMTDQAIITNIIMKDLYANNGVDFNCDDIIVENEKTFKYKDKINTINEYAKIGTIQNCNNDDSMISFTIPLSVTQLSDKDFNIYIRYKK